MPSAAWPQVVAAIMSTAKTALVDVRVERGRDITGETGDVVLVGVIEVEADWASAGTFQQAIQTFGGGREEVGTVNGLVIAWNGDSDQDAAADAAFDHLAALEAAVRATPTLGLTAFDYVFAEMQSGDIQESQNDEGAKTALSFAIAYKIRI